MIATLARVRRVLAGLCLIALAAACVPQGATQDTGEDSEIVRDSVPPHITQWMQQPAILVFSKTLGWRHNEGIAGADKFFVELARERSYGIFTTVNAAVFNEDDMARFDLVVFNNATGDVLSPEQEAVFQAWLEEGGAWIGLHGSGDNTHADWAWYSQVVIGPSFVGHPQTPHFNEVRVETLNDAHPIMARAPQVWRHDEEWYFFDSRPGDYGLLPLAGIHEPDFNPEGDDVEKLADWAMGNTPADHPVMWAGCPGEGRTFYSALGHSDLAYDVEVYRQILNDAFDWVLKQTDAGGAGCPAAAAP